MLSVALLVGALFVYFYGEAKCINTRLDLIVNTVQQFSSIPKKDSLNLMKLDSLTSQIINMKAEQIRYSEMINRESDRLIYFVTILFGLFGVVGFSIFKYELSAVSDTITKSNIDQDTKYNFHIKKMNELQKLAFVGMGNVCSIISDYNAQHDLYKSYNFSIGAALHFKRAFQLNNDNNFAELTTNNLANANNYIDLIINQNKNYKGNDFDRKEISDTKATIDEIAQIDNDKVKVLCTEIRYKFLQIEKFM